MIYIVVFIFSKINFVWLVFKFISDVVCYNEFLMFIGVDFILKNS